MLHAHGDVQRAVAIRIVGIGRVIDRLRHVDGNAAQRVDQLAEASKVDQDVVVKRDAKVVLDGPACRRSTCGRCRRSNMRRRGRRTRTRRRAASIPGLMAPNVRSPGWWNLTCSFALPKILAKGRWHGKCLAASWHREGGGQLALRA